MHGVVQEICWVNKICSVFLVQSLKEQQIFLHEGLPYAEPTVIEHCNRTAYSLLTGSTYIQYLRLMKENFAGSFGGTFVMTLHERSQATSGVLRIR